MGASTFVVGLLPGYETIGWAAPVILIVLRLQMEESPAFKKMNEEGTHSKAPISEAFGQWKNAKVAVLALFGLVAGQAVVWYTGQFSALFFIQNILCVDMFTSNMLIAWSLILGTGGFVIFGSLSDRIGREPIILAGCALAMVTDFPVLVHHRDREPGPLPRPAEHQGGRGREPGRLLVPVQSDGHVQIGNGWFGGLLPATSFAIIATTGNTDSGLWYPIIIAGMTVVIGALFVPNTHKKDIFADEAC
jgi:hypothetical protein